MKEAAHFSGNWLALREPVDHRSRAEALLPLLNAYLQSRNRHPIRIVDLGAGSGSNWRYLAPRLPGSADWLLVDHDAALLAHAAASAPGVRTETQDLRADTLAPCIAGADLVTASALIDLCSAAWLQALADACATAGSALLIALTIDGRARFTPGDAQDAAVLTALRHDEQRDKGMGPALGPDAAAFLAHALQAHGYQITCRSSDWVLRPVDHALLAELLAGWHAAALRQMPAVKIKLNAWLARRLDAAAHDAVTLTVGHQDLLALPLG